MAIYAIKSAPQNCGAMERNLCCHRGSLCVIQGKDPRSFLNALFRSFFLSSPTASLARWRSFKSYRGEENATTRSLCVTMSRAFLPARVRVTTPSCVCEERRRFSITDKHDIAITSRRAQYVIMDSETFLSRARVQNFHLQSLRANSEFSVYKDCITLRNEPF